VGKNSDLFFDWVKEWFSEWAIVKN